MHINLDYIHCLLIGFYFALDYKDTSHCFLLCVLFLSEAYFNLLTYFSGILWNDRVWINILWKLEESIRQWIYFFMNLDPSFETLFISMAFFSIWAETLLRWCICRVQQECFLLMYAEVYKILSYFCL